MNLCEESMYYDYKQCEICFNVTSNEKYCKFCKNDNIKIKNLTPHDFTLVNEASEVIITIPSEFANPSEAPRCKEIQKLVKIINNIKIYKKSFGEVDNLPEQSENTIYIVPLLIAQALKDTRTDLYIPNELVRDEKGMIIGARSLAKV